MITHAKSWPKRTAVCVLIFLGAISVVFTLGQSLVVSEPSPDEVLSEQQWKQVDVSVARALKWLASQQRRDGSFPTIEPGQPAVSSLCVLAFLARGHRPGEGPYGQNINAGIDFVLSCQKANGLLCYQVPERSYMPRKASHTYTYNHAIAGLLLGEVYGMTDRNRADRIRVAIERALKFTYEKQIKRPKQRPSDRGGWRYERPDDLLSDLSVTSWHLMFLRSAKNAGFNVPKENMDEGLGFVQRCFDSRTGGFLYNPAERTPLRAMAGAGILSLSLGGLHGTPMARRAGDWLLKYPFDRYKETTATCKRFHYDAFYCSQAMYQLGGKHWAQFYPVLVRTYLANQRPDGSWDVDKRDAVFGNALSTGFAVLALTTPYQLLPIFQR